MNYEEICERFQAQGSGSAMMGYCPAHDDSTRSLSISQSSGKILLHCFAGCTFQDILAAANLKASDLRNGSKPSESAAAPIRENLKATYRYESANADLLFEIQRFEEPGKKKTFRARRPVANGYVYNMAGAELVPYNLPEVVKTQNVLVVEGEKDVETARRFDLVATCNPFGAGKWRDQYSEHLRGKNVTVVPDGDEPGRKHAEQIAASLHGIAASVAICHLPSGIKDVTHYVELGFTRESLVEIIKQALAWKRASLLVSMSTKDMFAMHERKVDWEIYPFASRGLSSILDGPPKKGKTTFYLQGIHASMTGQPFLGWPTRRGRFVYVSEQSGASLAMQVREVGFTGEEPIGEMRWITREHWPRHTFEELLELIGKEILQQGDYTGIIFDTFHTISRMEDENAASEVNRVGNLMLNLASQFNLWLSLSRHDRKSGGEIGMSGRSSIQLSGLVDVILHLVSVPGQEDGPQRKLQLIGRIPGLPAEQIIELGEKGYDNLGEQQEPEDRTNVVRDWLAQGDLSGEQIIQRFAAMGVKISVATARRYKTRAKT